jgi:quercetin dioxygenase-like cupin family protein/L-amino acid N-acyltransferase YncA
MGCTVHVDNEVVRVTRWDLAVGEETGPHVHELDYTVVPVVAGRLGIRTAEGEWSEHELSAGEPYFREAGVSHNVSNAGTAALSFVEVEVRGGGAGVCRAVASAAGVAAGSDVVVEGFRVRPPREEDYPPWRELYRGYADFYRAEQPEESARTVWGWIHDPGHEVSGLVVEDHDGEVVGLAHYRPFARPLTATTGGFVDDLFVDPARRGSGAVDALFAALGRIAVERGWSVIRGITAQDNHRARAKYDRLATRTHWVTYDWVPARLDEPVDKGVMAPADRP